jgi:hypothetical protein
MTTETHFSTALLFLGATAHADGAVFSATDDNGIHLLTRAEIERLASLLERSSDVHEAFEAWGGAATCPASVVVTRIILGDQPGTVDADVVVVVGAEVVECGVTLCAVESPPPGRARSPRFKCGTPRNGSACEVLRAAIRAAAEDAAFDERNLIDAIESAVTAAWSAR